MIFKLILLSTLFISQQILASNNTLFIATTTSTVDSGLINYLNKEFENQYNVKINVLSLGTGQALKVAEKGNVELVLVHHKPSEIKFIQDGFGKERFNLMYNEFMIVGPKENKNDCKTIKETLLEIKNNKYNFLSRGDDSGTHKKEISLWNSINLDTNDFNSWYKKIGQGMGITLMMANEMKAFTLTDNGTWYAFKNKKNLKIICKNKPPLLNQYGIILVNSSLSPKLNIKLARKYLEWIMSEKGKNLINEFKIDGNKVFKFNYE